VNNSYAELESWGLVYCRQGSGIFVASAPQISNKEEFVATHDWPTWQKRLQPPDWHPCSQTDIRPADFDIDKEFISFSMKTTAEDLSPTTDFLKALKETIQSEGPLALGEGQDAAGFVPLRVTIAEILNSDGIPAQPENIVITSGSQQALNLIARLLLNPGDIVLVESPTYNLAIDLFRSLNVRLQGIPVDEKGMQVDKVEDILRRIRPRLIFTVPTFHNPTGTCMIVDRRRRLVALAARYDIPILEDDFIGNLRYEGPHEPALKSLAPAGRIIYVGTFSKVLMPAVRVGFIVAEGPIYNCLRASKHISDIGTSDLLQRALYRYLTVYRYQANLRRLCKAYSHCRDTMLEAIRHYLPTGTKWLTPKGGRYLWLQLPANLSADELFQVAIEEGVSFVPGSYFFPEQHFPSHLRLNFAINSPEFIEEGIKRLALAIKRLKASNSA
jgi:GntR family transcriptional regulator/MocR family aminotransferase